MMNRNAVPRIGAILLFATAAAPAWAVTDHSLNVALSAGDTLYIRFRLDDPSQLPSNFNHVEPNFSYSAATPSASTQTQLYNNADASIGVFNSTANFPHTGIGPTFIDPDLSNTVTNFCCGRTMASLNSYLDGSGMVSYTYQAGPGVTISTFRVLFGNSTDGGGSSPILDTTISYSFDNPPARAGFVPEPGAAALLLLGIAGVALPGRRHRALSYRSA
jgi:hypothetical protein